MVLAVYHVVHYWGLSFSISYSLVLVFYTSMVSNMKPLSRSMSLVPIKGLENSSGRSRTSFGPSAAPVRGVFSTTWIFKYLINEFSCLKYVCYIMILGSLPWPGSTLGSRHTQPWFLAYHVPLHHLIQSPHLFLKKHSKCDLRRSNEC